MWQHLIVPLRLLVAREKINTAKFHSTCSGASVDAWMTCQLVYALHVTVHYTSFTISLTYSYFTVLNVCLWIRNFLPLFDHFAWRTVPLFDMCLLLNALWLTMRTSGHTIRTTRTFGRSTYFLFTLIFAKELESYEESAAAHLALFKEFQVSTTSTDISRDSKEKKKLFSKVLSEPR